MDEKEKFKIAPKLLGEDTSKVMSSYSYTNQRDSTVAIRVVLADDRPAILPGLDHMNICLENLKKTHPNLNSESKSSSFWFSLVNNTWTPHTIMRTSEPTLRRIKELVCEGYKMDDGKIYYKGFIKFNTTQRRSSVWNILTLGGNYTNLLVYIRTINPHGKCDFVLRTPTANEYIQDSYYALEGLQDIADSPRHTKITNINQELKVVAAACPNDIDGCMKMLQKKDIYFTVTRANTLKKVLKILFEKPFHHDFKLSDFKAPAIPLHAFQQFAILLHGPSGMGKSKYALANGYNPLQVVNVDGLKNGMGSHDLLVWDGINFSGMTPENILNLVSIDDPEVRYMNVLIPRGTPRIFTSNKTLDELIVHVKNEAQKDAIRAKFACLLCDKPLYDLNETTGRMAPLTIFGETQKFEPGKPSWIGRLPVVERKYADAKATLPKPVHDDSASEEEDEVVVQNSLSSKRSRPITDVSGDETIIMTSTGQEFSDSQKRVRRNIFGTTKPFIPTKKTLPKIITTNVETEIPNMSDCLKTIRGSDVSKDPAKQKVGRESRIFSGNTSKGSNPSLENIRRRNASKPSSSFGSLSSLETYMKNVPGLAHATGSVESSVPNNEIERMPVCNPNEINQTNSVDVGALLDQ